MQTLEEFLVGSELRLRCQEVATGDDFGLSLARPWTVKHYRCELRGANGHRPVRTTMVSENGPPDVSEVLDSVAAQAAVVEEAASYEEWAARMGFDPDSRRGEQVYLDERRQAQRLRALLGEVPYRELLWGIERL